MTPRFIIEPAPPATTEQKLNEEVHKLRHEIWVLSRPSWKTPAFYLALLPLIFSLIFNLLQYVEREDKIQKEHQRAEDALMLADTKRALAELQLKDAQTQLNTVKQETATVAAEKIAIQADADTITQQRAERLSQLSALQQLCFKQGSILGF